MVAHQIQNRTDQQFGRQWGKRAGEYLNDNFYSRGATLSLKALMQGGTGEPLTPRYLIQFLKSPAEPSF
jgi:Zn-dependent M32 family carboxypeptidase